MEKNNEQKHFLSLQARPGDNAYVDISTLRISNGYNPTSLPEIDSFTMNFTYDELINSIKEANIADSNYLSGKLVITDNQKHNPLEVITKELFNGFDLYLFLTENADNKNLMNTIYTKYSSIVNDLPLAKMFKNSSTIEMTNMILKLPYLEQRRLLLYLIKKNNVLLEKDNKKEFVRDKIA